MKRKSSSKSSQTTINFSKMNSNDIKKLDFSDPELLQKLNIDPLPDLENSSFEELKELFNKSMIKLAIMESQRGEIFEELKKKHEPSNGD
jgi:hypothetical protein